MHELKNIIERILKDLGQTILLLSPQRDNHISL